jgi:hypothetical protein
MGAGYDGASSDWPVVPVPVASWNDALQLQRTSPLLSGSNKRSISCMTPATKHKPTAGALRVAGAIQQDASLLTSLPELIDRETGAREVLEILESIISEAGDLIESRSPELVAAARGALRRFSDGAPRQAE